MLGPFRIRNLKPYHPPALPHTEKLSACEAVVSLTGNEYQKNADAHPDSRLKYIDESDGEMITVGSSAELASRLQDVVPRRTRRVSASYHKSSGKMPLEPARPPSPELHIFEIDRTKDSVRIWHDIEQRYKDLTKELDPSHPFFKDRPDNDLEACCDPSDDAARLQEMQEEDGSSSFKSWLNHPMQMDEKARSLHFASSNPPQLPARHKTKSSEEDSLARYHKWGDSMMDKVSLALPKAPVIAPSLPNAPHFTSGITNDGKLTAEGQRQAIEAGSLLRMRNHQIWYPSPTLSGQKPINRWASYGTSKTSMVPNIVPNKSSEPINSSTVISRAPSLPKDEILLLQKWQEELAKMASSKASNTSSEPINPSTVAPCTSSPPQMEKPLLRMFQEELAKISKPLERLKLDSDCNATHQAGGFTTQPNQGPKPGPQATLVQIVEQLTNGIHSLASDAQVQFLRVANDANATSSQKNQSTNPEALAVILQNFQNVTQVALKDSRKAISSAAESSTHGLDIVTCQALVMSLKELSKGIDTFVTLLSATALIPQLQKDSSSETGFPNEPLEIEIGNIPESASQEQVRNLVLRALSIDGPFSGKPMDILSIRIIAATLQKPNVAQVRFRSHQVAVHVVTHLKGSQFGGKTLSATVPKELNRCKISPPKVIRSEHAAETKPPFTGFKELFVQESGSTGEAQSAGWRTTRGTAPNETEEPAVNEGKDDAASPVTTKARASVVRFADLPSIPDKRPLEVLVTPGAVNVPPDNPAISFRHVPSPMPGETIGRRRSSQIYRFPSFRSQNDAPLFPSHVVNGEPPPYSQEVEPSWWNQVPKSFGDHAKSINHKAPMPKAAKVEDEKVEHNPWLEDMARSREGLQQPSKKRSEPKFDYKDAVIKHLVSELPRKDGSPKFPNEASHVRRQDSSPMYPASNKGDNPDTSENADEPTTSIRPTSLNMRSTNPNSNPISYHWPQARIPQAPPGGWTPSNVKLYHGKNMNASSDAGPASVGVSSAAPLMGHSGRGYPEASEKNLRHSVSMGAIRKANSTMFGGFGLPARPDATRGRTMEQMCRPRTVFIPPYHSRTLDAEARDTSEESARPQGKAESTSTSLANNVDYLTGNADVIVPLAPSVPVLEQTRFPTLEQFEEREVVKENIKSIAQEMPNLLALPSKQLIRQNLAQKATASLLQATSAFSAPASQPMEQQVQGQEAAASHVMPGFPPLPSMEILTPIQPEEPEQNSPERREQPKSLKKTAEEPFCAPLYDGLKGHSIFQDSFRMHPLSFHQTLHKPSESPVSPVEDYWRSTAPTSESSGAFFKRMTGIDTSASELFIDAPEKPNESITEDALPVPEAKTTTLETSTPSLGPRLIRPFDPLAETAAIHRHKFIEGVARSNTIAGHGDFGKSRSRRPYSEYLPRVDDDPQRGTFADLTRPIRSDWRESLRSSRWSENSKSVKGDGATQGKGKDVEEPKLDTANFKEVRWGGELEEEKKEAQAQFALRRRSMHSLHSSFKSSGRAASPFMDPRPAPSLPAAAGASTTSLPIRLSHRSFRPNPPIPGSFPSPLVPDTAPAPVPRPFSFVDSSTPVAPSPSNDVSSVRVSVSSAEQGAAKKPSKIQLCVEQLKNFGYSSEDDGGVERLKIYAQDAKGDVWDAVEMIEGERRALGARG